MAQVTIVKGFYKGLSIENMTFTLTKPYDPIKGTLMVISDERLVTPDKVGQRCHIRVGKNDFFVTKDENDPVEETCHVTDYKASETDAMALNRIRSTFDHLSTFTRGIIGGHIRGLIVNGPPGVGKSFEVTRMLKDRERFHNMLDNEKFYCILKGTISAINLYEKMWEFKDSGKVLVLDDCDLGDDVDSFNMVKAALDSSDIREVAYMKNSTYLADKEIPKQFEYEGSMIFLTNVDFDDQRGSKGKHLGAIVSRCHYLDMDLNTTRDKLLRIKQVTNDGMLNKYGFNEYEQAEIIDFIFENAEHMRELSLRMVGKIADLKATFPTKWQDMAIASCMSTQGRYASFAKRMIDNREFAC